MKVHPTVERCLINLIGELCWNVKPGLHPCLTLEFGLPWLDVRGPFKPKRKRSKVVQALLAQRTVAVRGRFHLWTYTSRWSIGSKGRLLATSRQRAKIPQAANVLNGQYLKGVAFSRETRGFRLEFDMHGSLILEPSGDEKWFLFAPRGMVLAIRGDHMVSYHRSTTMPDDAKWLPLLR